MADKIVRIVADTSKYQKGIADAKKSLNGFTSGGDKAKQAVDSMLGSMTKMVSVTAVAAAGVKAFQQAVNATQTTADAYAIAIATMKDVTNGFFVALDQGNLTMFISNLKQAAAAAREAAKWVDQFGNTQMAYSYATTDIRAGLQEQVTILDVNSGASDAEKAVARNKAREFLDEWKDALDNYSKVATATVSSNIASLASGYISSDKIQSSTIDKILKIDAGADYAAQREKYAAEYKEFIEKWKALNKEYEDAFNSTDKEWKQVGSELVLAVPEETQNQLAQLKDRIDADKESLSSLYEEAIVFNSLLEVKTDQDLQSTYNMLSQVNNEMRQLERQTKKVNTAIAQFKPTTVGRESLSALSASPIQSVAVSGGVAVPDATANLNALTERLNTQQLDEYNKKLAAIAANKEKIDSLGSAFAQLGYAMSASGNDALAAAGSIVAMIAQVVPAMTTLFAASSAAGTAEAVAETPTLAGKIAAIATVTAGIISMVSTFKNLQFAEGGIVPGSNFTDGITARVSSGEMVLNAHDQRNLYESIKGGNIGGGGRSYVTGEQLVTVINNYGRRTGRGEILR